MTRSKEIWRVTFFFGCAEIWISDFGFQKIVETSFGGFGFRVGDFE
jgi:hypothetical protein